MPLPELRAICLGLDISPSQLCITYPVGQEICVQWPSLVPGGSLELVKQLLAQLNAALAPLSPIFNIIDAVMAVFDCVKAISTLDPVEIFNCIPGLAQAVDKLIRLLPQFSIPILIIDFIDALIAYLVGLRAELLRMGAALARLIEAATLAALPGNVALNPVIDCATGQLESFFVFLNEMNAPLNRLIGVINTFMELVGLGKYKIPQLACMSYGLIDPTILVLDNIIDFLRLLRSLIPLPQPPQFDRGPNLRSPC